MRATHGAVPNGQSASSRPCRPDAASRVRVCHRFTPYQLPQPRRFETAWLYHWQRHPHDVLARLIRVFARPGAVAVDVGTYMGWYTYLLAGQVGLTGRVHCFEPDPALRPLLEALVGALPPVQAHFVGAGDQPAGLPFYQGSASQSSPICPPPLVAAIGWTYQCGGSTMS